MLRLHASNRYETLQARLVARLAPGRGAPFEADTVIVPSAAHRRALTLALADAHGICANLRFGYLADWLWAQVVAVVPGVSAESPFAAGRLSWRVLAAFDDPAFVGAHPRLAAYLGQADAVMRFELAARVAALFEQYVTYRPDWLDAWQHGRLVEAIGSASASSSQAGADQRWQAAGADQRWQAAGADQRWQAALWQRLVDELGLRGRDPVADFLAAMAKARPGEAAALGLPGRAQVIAPPAIPPVHLTLLQALARVVEIDLYLVNPCREYWFELVDARRLAHLAARGRAEGHEVGHRLLAGWGRQTQALIDGLWSLPEGEAVDEDAGFVEPPADSLLGRLQGSILDLCEPVPGSFADLARDGAAPPDIELHVCHSTTRELEVLHDRLLARFAADPSLRPSDVLVVTPDLEAAAPLVEAVFGTAPPARRLPFAISGRARGVVAAPARALLALLAVCDSRWAVRDLVALLQMPIVARRFDLDETGLQQVHDWLLAAGVHWGADASHRDGLGLPAAGRHSIGEGLDRLFLGYALPDAADRPFAGHLPCGAAEGSDAIALGGLWRFVDALAGLRARVAVAHGATGWERVLDHACERFLDARGDELEDLQELRATIRALAADIAAAGDAAVHSKAEGPGADAGPAADDDDTLLAYDDVDAARADGGPHLPLAVLRAALAERLDDGGRAGVPTGRITFAPMQALRGLPFRVVAAFGLNDGLFPSDARPAEFDLMALAPRRADRQRRADERNVFLDLLLAARDGLHLSHVGRSVRDNAPMPPSVLVAELLDLLVPALAENPDDPDSRRAARERIVVEHPLQGFSPEAFRIDADPRRRSHHEDYAQALQASLRAAADDGRRAPGAPGADRPDGAADAAAQAAAAVVEAVDTDDDEAGLLDQATLPPFFAAPLPAPEPAWRTVTLAQLVECFRHPARYLLRRRLGLDLGREAPELADDEPFLVDPAARRGLVARLLPPLLEADAADEADAAAAAALAARAREIVAAGTDWPGGPIGAIALDELLGRLRWFAARVREDTREPLQPPHTVSLAFDLDGEAWRLDAAFADLRAGGRVRWRHEPLRAPDAIEDWIGHVVLCAAAPPGIAPRTVAWHRDGRVAFDRPDDPQAVLATLLRWYRRNLCAPIPFYPRAAYAFVEHGDDWRKAAEAWTPSRYKPGAEGDDAAWRLALRGRIADALSPAFANCAHEVLDPMWRHAEGLDR